MTRGWKLARRALRACQRRERAGFGKFGEDDLRIEVRGLLGPLHARQVAMTIIDDWCAADGGRRARRRRVNALP